MVARSGGLHASEDTGAGVRTGSGIFRGMEAHKTPRKTGANLGAVKDYTKGGQMDYRKLWLHLLRRLEVRTSWGKEQLKKLMKDMELAEARGEFDMLFGGDNAGE